MHWLGHVCNVFKGGLRIPLLHLILSHPPSSSAHDALCIWIILSRGSLSRPIASFLIIADCSCGEETCRFCRASLRSSILGGFERSGRNWATSHAGTCSFHMQSRWTEKLDSSFVHGSCGTPITVGGKASDRDVSQQVSSCSAMFAVTGVQRL